MFTVLDESIFAAQYLSKTKMLVAENVLDLRSKVSTALLASVKKKLGAAQTSAAKKKPKRKLVLQSDSQNTSEGSATFPIALPTKKRPRTIKVKNPNKTTFVADISSKPSAPHSLVECVLSIEVFKTAESQHI